MNENPVIKLNDEYQRFLAGKIDRRQLLKQAQAAGLSAAAIALFGRVVPDTSAAQNAKARASVLIAYRAAPSLVSVPAGAEIRPFSFMPAASRARAARPSNERSCTSRLWLESGHFPTGEI